MPDELQVNAEVAFIPYPGTKKLSPDSIAVLDYVIGEGINRCLIEAQGDENIDGVQLGRLAARLKMAGEAFMELGGPVLKAHIERSQEPKRITAVEGVSFNDQDKIDLDIVFSVARESMRALGWNEAAITTFLGLQYRLRLVVGR